MKNEEQKKVNEARIAEERALALAQKEIEKRKEACEEAQATIKRAEMESKKRMNAEQQAKLVPTSREIRYRKYSIEEIENATEYFSVDRKIGEGSYGPVFKARLDHTAVAIKVLRPDATQGKLQFQQEVNTYICANHVL